MSQNDYSLKKKLYAVGGAAIFSLYSLLCFVISPIYVATVNDIAYDDTIVPELLSYLGVMVELMAIAIFYAVLILGIHKFCLSKFRGGIVLFILATLYKYSINVLMDWLKNGSIPREWFIDVANVLFYCLLEAIQLVLILFIAKRILTKAQDTKYAATDKISFVGLYNSNNPFMRSALACSLVVALSKILGLLINDVMTMAISGLPEKAGTVGLMILAYLSNVLLGFLCYVVLLFVIMKLVERYRISES